MKQPVLCILIFLIGILNLNAQHYSDTEIYHELKAKDSLLFDRAFNYCESNYLEDLLSEDFEFYHDTSGITESKSEFIAIMKNGICNPDNQTKSRRELVLNSLKTFPLKNNGKLYGALQIGTHKFFETTNSEEVAGSIAKFSHLWILENKEWKLKRVISYDHKNQSKT